MEGVIDENAQVAANESGLEIEKPVITGLDDANKARTGTLWSASAHIITAVIGSGVLSLAWGVAQLGWLPGVATLVIFPVITLYTSNLLTDCYRSPTGLRTPTYNEVVRNYLGKGMYLACCAVQLGMLAGLVVGYTITASISLVAIHKSDCTHRRGHEAPCNVSYNQYMIGMGILEIFLSQIPNFDKLSFLSFLAAVMSFAYASIGAALSLTRVVSGQGGKTSLTGIEIGVGLSVTDKIWRVFRAFGNIAFAYSYAIILIEIEDTLKPPENVVMKKANLVAVFTTTAFYVMCGCFGYAAFGNNAPGNLLTGFGSFEPFWLVDLVNVCVVVHLVGAYQVCAQPLFNKFEVWCRRRFPESKIVTADYSIGIGKKKLISVNVLRLMWRSLFVGMMTLIALIIPFFNDVLAFLGAIGYWPLSVYFPITLHIARNKIRWWTRRWLGLQLLNVGCLLVALAAASGAVEGLSKGLKTYTPFKFKE